MTKTLADIKKSLDHHLGKRLQLKANGGRKKTIERAGVLRETYHAVFVIDLDQDENSFERVSYSYADVLTEAVEITIFDEANNLIVVKWYLELLFFYNFKNPFSILLNRKGVFFWFVDILKKLVVPKEDSPMSRKGIMSKELKEEIAKDLGFYDVVKTEGWGGIKSRDAGNMVKRAIEMAEQQARSPK